MMSCNSISASSRRRSAGRLWRSCGGGFWSRSRRASDRALPDFDSPFYAGCMLVRPDDGGIDGMLLVSWRPKNFARISNAASHTPILLQRVKRTKTEFQLPYGSGMSRQGAPVRRTQRMPLTIRRLSEIGGPRSPRSGSKGLRMCHSEFVRSPATECCLPQKGSLESKPDSSVKNCQRGLANRRNRRKISQVCRSGAISTQNAGMLLICSYRNTGEGGDEYIRVWGQRRTAVAEWLRLRRAGRTS